MKKLTEGIYGLTALEFSKGRGNVMVSRQMLEGGIRILQYRDKTDRPLREKYRECLEIRRMCSDHGALFIVNDYIDIALMVDADGVHIGQDDYPLQEIRKLRPELMIGLSTHSPEQAVKAVKDGADYIGVGPVYSTQTKKNVCAAVGLNYVRYASGHVSIPWVAIGGIKKHNIRDVLAMGARTIALVTEITGADDIRAEVLQLRQIMAEAGISC